MIPKAADTNGQPFGHWPCWPQYNPVVTRNCQMHGREQRILEVSEWHGIYLTIKAEVYYLNVSICHLEQFWLYRFKVHTQLILRCFLNWYIFPWVFEACCGMFMRVIELCSLCLPVNEVQISWDQTFRRVLGSHNSVVATLKSLEGHAVCNEGLYVWNE